MKKLKVGDMLDVGADGQVDKYRVTQVHIVGDKIKYTVWPTKEVVHHPLITTITTTRAMGNVVWFPDNKDD